MPLDDLWAVRSSTHTSRRLTMLAMWSSLATTYSRSNRSTTFVVVAGG